MSGHGNVAGTREAAAGPAAAPGATNRRRTIVIAIIAGLVVLAVAAAAFLLNRPRTETAAPAQTSAPAPETTPEPTPTPTPTPTPDPPPVALNILLIGSDSRVNERAVAASGGTVRPARGRPGPHPSPGRPAERLRHLHHARPWVNIPGYGARQGQRRAGTRRGAADDPDGGGPAGPAHQPHRDGGLPGLRRHDRRARRGRRQHQAALHQHGRRHCVFPGGREQAHRGAGAGLCPRAPCLRRRRLPAGPEPADLPQSR